MQCLQVHCFLLFFWLFGWIVLSNTYSKFLFFLMFSYTTELLEVQAGDPTFQVLLILGNPGLYGFRVRRYWVFVRLL